MIADILAVWPGTSWTVVQARDQADGVIKPCRIWMHEDIGPWMATHCQRAKGPMVLTVEPPVNGEYEITHVEAVPLEVA